jgi:hypothetical protein
VNWPPLPTNKFGSDSGQPRAYACGAGPSHHLTQCVSPLDAALLLSGAEQIRIAAAESATASWGGP